MFVSLFFWLTFLLPGYAAVRLIDQDDADCGLMGTVGLAFFWAFALLSPIAILCYTLRLPVLVFSIACVLLVLAGVVTIQRRKWWRPLGRLVLAGAGIELVLLLVDLIMGANVGAYLAGDAEIHVARIRYLIEHGISNQDPFCSTPSFYAVYHTNLLHALQAAGARLTGVHYLDAWSISLVWAKLACFGGCYYLGWSVLRSRWAAWIPALYLYAVVSPVTFLIYPNQIAVYWLMPIAFAFGVQALRESSRHVPLKLAAASFLLGQVHALYALFAGLLIAPLLAVVLGTRLIRRQGGRRSLILSLLALLAGAPFPLVGRYGGEAPPPGPIHARSETPEEATMNAAFAQRADGTLSLKFAEFMDGQGALHLGLLAAGAGLLMILNRRWEALGLLAVSAVILVAVFVPPVCTRLIGLLGERWPLLRICTFIALASAVAAAGAVALIVERYHARWWTRALLGGLAVLLGVGPIYARSEHGWRNYLQTAVSTRSERRGRLDFLHASSEFFAENIPAGSTVLAAPRQGRSLVMICDCYVVAPDRGGGVAPDMVERNLDVQRLLAADTLWAERRNLLAKYQIDRILMTGLAHADWARDDVRGVLQGPGVTLLVLKADWGRHSPTP